PGLPVYDRVLVATHSGGDHGNSTGHRLHGGDAEGFVPGNVDRHVHGADQRGYVGAVDTSQETHPIGQAHLVGDRAQTRDLRVRLQLVGIRSPHQGTTVTLAGRTPQVRSCSLSSCEVATTRALDRATNRSTRSRSGGLVSASPWKCRLVDPNAWKVWSTGTPRSAATGIAAMPLIQKWAWTTSGLSR